MIAYENKWHSSRYRRKPFRFLVVVKWLHCVCVRKAGGFFRLCDWMLFSFCSLEMNAASVEVCVLCYTSRSPSKPLNQMVSYERILNRLLISTQCSNYSRWLKNRELQRSGSKRGGTGTGGTWQQVATRQVPAVTDLFVVRGGRGCGRRVRKSMPIETCE